MSSLELKVPPPAVALFFGFLMWFASSLAAPVEVPFGARVAVALVLASLGLVFGISGMASVWRAKTTMNPTKPTVAVPACVGRVLVKLAGLSFVASVRALHQPVSNQTRGARVVLAL